MREPGRRERLPEDVQEELEEGRQEELEEELVMFLERDQLSSDRSRPLPRAPLDRHVRVALWALRVFALVVSAMVIYTFVAQLGS